MAIPSKNLGHCFDASLAPDKVVIIDVGDPESPVSLTYAQLEAECAAVAAGLLARGLRRGDRVGILSLNRYELIAALCGIMRAGMVAVPISFKLAPETVRYIIDDAGLSALFHDAERRHLCPPQIPAIGFDAREGYAALRGAGPFATVDVGDHELAMMLYTSGSTGRPKGVLLSHLSQRWALEQAVKLYGDMAHHRFVVAAPMFHMNATFSVQQALAFSASLLLMPSFDAAAYARAIARFRVTWLTSVPTMLALVARERALLGGLDLSCVERVTMGSAPLTQALIDKVQAIFPQALINNSYGTTEAGPVPFGPHPTGLPRPPLALGYPVPGSEVELREGSSPDEGVLCMKSPMLMEGYRNLPERTAEALRGGWYRSGDIARRDENGFYYFVGRADDMFVVGGENVWPGEVERMIEKAPGVHQAIVVPVADEIKGALPLAFVVPQPGASVDERSVKEFALANGPAFAHPRWVELIDFIPLAATNKPDRRRLTEQAEEIARRRGRASTG